MRKIDRGHASNVVAALDVIVHGIASERDRPRACPRDVAGDAPRATVELQRRSARYAVVASIRCIDGIGVAPVKAQQATAGPDRDRAA